MKSKLGILGLVVFSGVLLSGCNTKTTTETNQDMQNQTTQTQQNGTQAGQLSGTPPQGGPQMDLAAAAKTLGVTEEALKSALGIEDQVIPPADATTVGKPSGTPNKDDRKQMDLAAAAKTLGVTEEALRSALGMNDANGGQPPEGTPPVEK